jgi:hypothetical protein
VLGDVLITGLNGCGGWTTGYRSRKRPCPIPSEVSSVFGPSSILRIAWMMSLMLIVALMQISIISTARYPYNPPF